MKVALCQLNPVTGDITGNTGRIKDVIVNTANKSPDLLIFPELFIQGYPPRDLLEHNWFIANTLSALDELREFSQNYPDIGIITGLSLPNNISNGKGLFNSAVLLTNGKILFHQNKSLLPSYDIFDEIRYFDPAPDIELVEFKGEKLGITICEDAWNAEYMWDKQRYNFDPVKNLAEKGASMLINISASPFNLGKGELRFSLIQNHAKQYNLPFIFVNMTGGNDELVFDGNSMYFDKTGSLCEILPSFKENVKTIDTKSTYETLQKPEFDSIDKVYDALVMGIRDYVRKCGFEKAIVGLSGGIDSAVTCTIAVEALGTDNVMAVTMPSQYSSDGSIFDSQKLARNLGIEIKTIPIQSIFTMFEVSLNTLFEDRSSDVTEENIQARIRSTILMALSNKYGALLLSTGNKSELAVGYCTLYGDMCGGLAVISDVYKTKVYELASYINSEKEIIPETTITKPPSAELSANQKDIDTLPPYDILDGILSLLIENGMSEKEIVSKGYNKETVQWIINAVVKNEYKRMQSAPGLKITQKAFGSGRRFPIAARYIR